MEIILAGNAGFCFGVKRAIKIAFDASEDYKEDVYTLGPIIHNPQVVERLETKGVKSIDSPSALSKGVMIIRCHGAPSPKIIEEAEERGIKVLDATCPFVKKAHRHAIKLYKEGYQVVIVGDKKHPEVQGILGCIDGNASVVEGPEDIAGIPLRRKIGIIAQTTQSYSNFSKIVVELLKNAREVKVYNTICDATTLRQEEARELAEKVDLMLVVGGRNSANTTRLAQLCSESCKKVYHIEVAEEIEEWWFDGVEQVGVTAGASTPMWIIEDTIKRLQEIDNKGKGGV